MSDEFNGIEEVPDVTEAELDRMVKYKIKDLPKCTTEQRAEARAWLIEHGYPVKADIVDTTS